MRGVPFDVERCVKAVEDYISGAKNVDEIVREAGMSEPTFYNKLREYRENGGRIHPPKRKGKELKRTEEFNDALKGIKMEHPNYGTDRLTRELKSRSFAVSGTTVSRALNELSLQLPPKRGASTMRTSSGGHRSRNEA